MVTKHYLELQHVLEKLTALHRNLIGVLREEYSHMSALDVKGMAEAAHAKEILLAEIVNHETLRIKVTENLAKALGLDPNTLTVMSLAAALTQQHAENLRQYRTVLTLLVSQAKELNAKNSIFAESSLGRIEQMKKNVLGLNNNSTKDNYSNSGMRNSATEQGGRLLSTEA